MCSSIDRTVIGHRRMDCSRPTIRGFMTCFPAIGWSWLIADWEYNITPMVNNTIKIEPDFVIYGRVRSIVIV